MIGLFNFTCLFQLPFPCSFTFFINYSFTLVAIYYKYARNKTYTIETISPPGFPPWRVNDDNDTFLVKASNSDGIWSKNAAGIIVIIHPPWWKTWWAYCFYGVCVYCLHIPQWTSIVVSELKA